ncbi:Inositol 1, 3, 4-trisphosphate 5/6-kinase family protein [Tritrichomonas foetus]|uniref:Inositol-tetrakisphosphate 1-kinase n=1 Tax=Tritrichomonas foetus TaxID=1144522 RepID=A0A1J4KLN4_9EUKA|nr:Inositol 1, 3, 4-trisphosphate 5/6-kinase family protein [Tritrichomonas foetus]|eukprot:OHT10708.1 Inositol 1, 3, 4-trisphosphate 5/6-kinase family protein [Tritrichomonas foetus]
MNIYSFKNFAFYHIFRVLKMTRIRIGYCGPPEKWDRMKWNDFINYAKDKNVDLVWIDLDKPIEEQGEFRLIIQKMTYIMQGHDMTVNPQLHRLYNYSKTHPEVRFIDDFDAVAVTMDREELNAALESISWPDSCKVNVPQAKLLLNSDAHSINDAIKNLHFPLLAKPKGAASSTAAHLMKLATKPEQLVGVPTPTMLQEYINHDGVVYKIYALGDIIEVGARPSSRNIEDGECVDIDFDSQKMTEKNGFWTEQRDLSNVEIPLDDFKTMSAILRKAMKMELIGFDILIDSQKRYWIVDLNYFPGYKNIQNLWEKFLNFFMKEIGEPTQ